MSPFLRAAALGLVLLFPLAQAGRAEAPPYLAPGAIDPAKVLPPPPAAGSREAQADLLAVLQAQAWRTPAEVAWAQFVAKDFFDTYDMGILGPWYTEHDYPLTYALQRQISSEDEAVSNAAKKLFQRDRPFMADARVHPCVSLPKSGSYPSNHAFGAYVWAALLSQVFPEHAADLAAQADRIAWGRVIGGVHFPSDTVAAKLLAEAFMKRLMENPDFQKALDRCREEAAKVQVKKAA